MRDKVQEQTLEAVRLSRPEDYDGHTEFDRMTPGQRLAWLDQATMFVFNQRAAAKKKKLGKSKSW
jgi:surface antigen